MQDDANQNILRMLERTVLLDASHIMIEEISCDFVLGRDEAVSVSRKHAVNGNPTVPPFPQQMKLAMIGKRKQDTLWMTFCKNFWTSRKHAYSKLLKMSPPKTESFQIKILNAVI